MNTLLQLLLTVPCLLSSPILTPSNQPTTFNIKTGFCFLPLELGEGEIKFLEDCNNLGESRQVPGW